jgi:hypothetical protein
MKNSDKPTGQRIGDGCQLGQPFAEQYTPRTTSVRHCDRIHYMGWTDKAGMPHGRSGDKLARKAFKRTFGLSVIR